MRYLLILILLCGCDSIRIGRQDETKKETTEKQRTVAADVLVEVDPYLVPGLPNQPTVPLNVLGEVLNVPANAKVTVKLKSNDSLDQHSVLTAISSLKVSKKMGSLFLIGAFCIAGGAVLCYLGIWKLGVGACCFGFVLLGCGVAIDRYPMVFLVVLLVVLVGCGYMIYHMIKSDRQAFTLQRVCERIDMLKQAVPEAAKEYITDPLAKDNHSSVLKKHITEARQ